ncbi:hypothetical protein ACWKW4_13815 [Hydrogenophaga borbori]|uniref:hypothetical protein n=1 Tax=Hydrogenophaga borbori TaxID=2294117 RepID=UPI00301B9F4B
MNEHSDQPAQRHFTVVLRGASAVVLEDGPGLGVRDSAADGKSIVTHARTRWLGVNGSERLPGHLCLEAVGWAESLDDAIDRLTRSAVFLIPLLSLSANAAIGDCEMELAYESTDGLNEREFIQSFLPEESQLLRPGRLLDIQATGRLLEAIQTAPDKERIMRAANQYWLALQAWRYGFETLCVAHLWMAVEALTKAMIRTELSRKGLSNEAELSDYLGCETKKLDAEIRRRYLLKGDEECYSKGRLASDGLEHGYLGFDEIRAHAIEVRDRMASLVRSAILEIVQLDAKTTSRLLSSPFDRPVGPWPLARTLRGKLVGADSQLAAVGNPYPFFSWKAHVENVRKVEGGRLVVNVSETMTAHLGPGIVFVASGHQVRER